MQTIIKLVREKKNQFEAQVVWNVETVFGWFASIPGAKYPKVPATNVETWVLFGCIKVANPKSETRASIFSSNNMLLDLMSLWIMRGMQSWWRYDIPLAAPAAILYLVGQSKNFLSLDLPASLWTLQLETQLSFDKIPNHKTNRRDLYFLNRDVLLNNRGTKPFHPSLEF